MCRLFLWLHLTDRHSDHHNDSLERLLMYFLKQSDHIRKHTPGIQNKHDHSTHTDGFGFAWFRKSRWSTYRNPLLYSRVPDLPELLQHVSRENLVLGHIRRATEPTIASVENTHPFYYRNHVFIHNGEIHGFPEKREVVIREIAADLRTALKGQTDSEAVFYLFLTYLRELAGPKNEILPKAFVRTVQFLESHFEWILLNIAVSDKTHTLVSRYGSRVGNHRPPSLYWNLTADSLNITADSLNLPVDSLNLKTISKTGIAGVFPKVILSSDRMLKNAQSLVPANTLMVIENQTGHISISNTGQLLRNMNV